MAESRTGTESLTPVQRALLEIRSLKGRLADAERAANEPIAIVGMGLRFPGDANDASSLARLLWSGTDAITTIPADRWDLDRYLDDDADAPGKMFTRHGGFLSGVDRFDAEFFGVAPVEAASMDPQQRLVLEVAWEALENAGRSPHRLAGSRTGVYLGISNNDYGRTIFGHPELIDPYFSPGNAYSVAAGRLSYVLGLHGPSIAVDTACSSSLVALHLAVQGLRSGDCDLALVGGVNLILAPEMNINFSKARMMARDGRCKTFDAAADGYVRGEGCAVLVVRRLADALAANDRVLAVVRGTAVNQDGRSGGLTAPNGPAQEAVISAALAAAGVEPAAIGYVEAHGTGTSLGDPIEVGALGAVLGRGRDPARPFAIGSIKTNLGHLEAAAGIAGVVKVVLGLQRREIPPHLHFHEPNPFIDWAAIPVTVPTAVTPWDAIDGRRLAGVSSFGFSGTNAHVVIEEAPAEPSRPQGGADRPLHVLALSARDATALTELATRYAAALEDKREVADICFTANAGRVHFAHRISVQGATAADLRNGLQASAEGTAHPAVTSGVVAPGARPRVAFLFSGQGAQSAGMGRALYETSPVFRAELDRAAACLAPLMDRPLLELLYPAHGAASAIDETRYAQPATAAFQLAMTALWRSWGIEPSLVLGHSLGEFAAAAAAGMLSREDVLKAVAERGRLAHELPGEGAMAVIFASEDAVADGISATSGSVSIAAINGPENVVISGGRAGVEAVTAHFAARGVRVKSLRISHGFHSPLVEPALPAFGEVMAGVRWSPPRAGLISNLTGAMAGLEELSRADYWTRHMRMPVRFEDSMRVLAEQGVTHCVEIGPHPVLVGMGAECLPQSAISWLPSIRRDREEWPELLATLQALYVAGADVDWEGFEAGRTRRRVALPTYPFRRRRHWVETGEREGPRPQEDAWERLGRDLDRQAEQGPLDLNASSYPEKWDCLARLVSAQAVHTLRAVGLFLKAGEQRTLDQVLAVGGIGSTYRHLVGRWLDRLVTDGLLRRVGDDFVADAPLSPPAMVPLWAEAKRRFADNTPLLAYVRHCSSLVTAVLTGKESPLETLFPGGSFELAQQLYEQSTTMRYVNGMAASALRLLGDAVPAGHQLRVLEIGAGTGGTTSALLPMLRPEHTRYCFSDVSDVFLDRARERFGASGFVDFARFDLDSDPAAQGFAAASLDVVVSANAVHASRDLTTALSRIRELLAPGGMLVLVESTSHLAWFDITTGLIEGWQHFSDDLRTDNPLLAPEAWLGALRRAGFADAGFWPRAGSAADHVGQHLIVARVPGAAGSLAGEAAAPRAAARAEVARPDAAHDEPPFRAALAAALPGERLDLLREFVRRLVVQVLRYDGIEPPGRGDRLMELGFDSLMAVQLRNRLGAELELARPLPATLMFDYPTIDAIAAYLLELVAPTASERNAPAPGSSVPAPLSADAVAALTDAEIEALLLGRLGGT